MRDKSDFLKIIGNKLKSIRIRNGISQEKLGELCGLHRTYIGMVERGEKNITIYNVWLISESLNVDLKSIFNEL